MQIQARSGERKVTGRDQVSELAGWTYASKENKPVGENDKSFVGVYRRIGKSAFGYSLSLVGHGR